MKTRSSIPIPRGAPSGRISPSDLFLGDVDDRAIIQAFPKDQTLKGMFFGRFVDALASDWAAVALELAAPPALGRYIPFADYPNADHMLLAFRCARRRFPALGSRESIRRVAQEDMGTFLSSTLGRITSAMLSTPDAALAALPSVYQRVSKGPRYQFEAAGPQRAVLRLSDSYGPWEYVIGQLEGIMLHYGGKPTVVCAAELDGTRRFEVSW